MKNVFLLYLNQDLIAQYQLCKHCLVGYSLASCLKNNTKKNQRKNWSTQFGIFPYMLYFQILSDQYQLQDVLERTDQVIAVAKDLVGDAPRTRTGRPSHLYVVAHLRVFPCFS